MEAGLTRTAGVAGVLAFFAAVFAGILGDNPLTTCALRGVAAGIVIYIVVRIAGRATLRLIVEEMVEHEMKRRRRSERDG